MAVLLKGGVELSELYGGNLISINEMGQLETRPKTDPDKISVSKWTDAFLIFASICLVEYPQRIHEILKYMSTIREAASRFPGFGWRIYDEQVRLRQALKYQPWGTINSDLWLRCFSSSQGTCMVTASSSASSKTPACIDFNKGACHSLIGQIVDTHMYVQSVLLHNTADGLAKLVHWVTVLIMGRIRKCGYIVVPFEEQEETRGGRPFMRRPYRGSSRGNFQPGQ